MHPRAEDGLALVAALGILVFFSVATVTAVVMTRSTQTTATASNAAQGAVALAESGINNAEAILNYQNSVVGGNPSAANLLGCNGVTGPSDTNAPSDCSSPSPLTMCISVASGCTAGTAGTASIYGYFSGTNAGSYGGTTLAASTWLIMSTGYVASPTGGVTARTMKATVLISPMGTGAVASVWNHIFITAPLVANTCQLDYTGANNVNLNVPIYTIGNVCLGTNTVQETTQPIDFMVGGKLYMTSGGVGVDSTHKLTSGVVAGGCTTVSISATTFPCGNGSYHYWVTTADTFIPQDAPTVSGSDIASDYANFDPGPSHSCQSGNHPNAPLASSVFDNDTTQNNSAGTFTLTPNSSYSCWSQSGSSTGELSWNNSTKILTVNGNIFIDGSLIINQSLVYSGTAIIEAAGTITISGNNLAICAVAGCAASCSANWQGSSGNNSMLTLATLATNTTSITFQDNAQTFEGSLWAQPTSKMTFVKNSNTVYGPISIGSLDSTFNNATMCPLPVIKNMPTGAPIPPNTSASVGAPVYR